MTAENTLEPLTTTALVRRDIVETVQRPASLGISAFLIRQILAGSLVIIIFLCAIAVWSSLAPLNSAVVAAGIVEVSSHRKTIQHLEGGLVDTIFVRDGDAVVKGQPLIKLRQVDAAAELAQLEGQLLETVAIIGGLMAQQSGASDIVLPEEFQSQANQPPLDSILMAQKELLESQRQLQNERDSVLIEQTAQIEEMISGLQLQINAREVQRDLLIDELSQLAILEGKRLISRTRILARRQELARIEGDLGEYQAEIARLRKSISEAKLQMSEARAAEAVRINKQLREERARFRDLSHRITSARDVVSRTTITSPIDGVVVNMNVHTINGVVAAGNAIMDIVPTGDELVVQALIDPKDINEVQAGMPADVKLRSLTRRSRVPIEGVVSDVSPDRLIDRPSGRSFYKARVEFTPTMSDADRQTIIAGMGADVFIRTGERTALEYLVEPISRNFSFGLREK